MRAPRHAGRRFFHQITDDGPDMDYASAPFWIAVLQIVWIDILLSGDNAVVIAMACRSLPERQRRLGILLGAGTAVALRIVFALVVSTLLGVPFLRILGGVLLLWIAVRLVTGEDEDVHDLDPSHTLWRAVRTIAIADAVMSLDNVVAIAAASKGHPELFVLGLLLSIPLIVTGASLIAALIQRFPAVIWAGAGLLGWIAGEMVVTDPLVASRVAAVPTLAHYGAATAGAMLVVLLSAVLGRRRTEGAGATGTAG